MTYSLITNYSILSLREKAQWEEYLSLIPNELKDIYFSPDYIKIYEDMGDGKAHCFVYKEESLIVIYPFLLNSTTNLNSDLKDEYFDIVSIYGYNGIISNCQNEQFIENFHKAFNIYCKENNIIAEFFRFHPILHQTICNDPQLEIKFDRKTVGFEFDQDTNIENFYSKNTRRDINIAKKNGLSVEVLNDGNYMFEDFIRIYTENMNRVYSIPYLYFNKKYFYNLFEYKHTIQFVVKKDNNVIASSICLCSEKIMHYHLGCSMTEYLYFCPNNLLIDSMLRYAKENNFSTLYLGGGASSKEDDTLLRFKEKFSNIKYNFNIGMRIHNPKIYNHLVTNWENENPEKKDFYKNYFYKYRK